MHGSDNVLLTNSRDISPEECKSLLRAYQSGNTEAGGELIKSQAKWIFKSMRAARIPPCVDQDDVFSELCIVLLDSLKSYDPDASALSTWVAVIVQRRTRRIVRKLQGAIGRKTVDCERPLEMMAEDAPDTRFEEILEAVEVAGLRDEAVMAVRMWTEGYKNEAIDSRIRERYPRAQFHSVDSLIENALAAIKSEMRKLGYEIPGDRDAQPSLFAKLAG